MTHIPVGGKGFKFDGDLHNGTIVNHRAVGQWVVSFRPIGGDSSRRRCYNNPYVVVRAIIERQHQDEPKHPRGTTDVEWRELADECLDDDAASGVDRCPR